MSEARADAVPLGPVDPAGSRHQGRRSAVALVGDLVVAGTATGTVVAFDRETLAERWRHEGQESVVALAAVGGEAGATAELDDDGDPDATPDLIAGTRGQRGAIRRHDGATGAVRWRLDAGADVGDAQRDTRFFLPFVAAVATVGDRTYAAARRYERDEDGDRHFQSVVYAVDPSGTVDWRFRTDASPIALDAADDRVAVAYNRCPCEHQHGLVVLDPETGQPRWDWDPGTTGQRRVGDVSLLDDGAVVASHGDYCGYRLGPGGREAWRVGLATPREMGDETVYAYPNHVHATGDGAVFVTGNTYPEDGRETDARHPCEHTAVGVSPAGERTWDASVGGFASGVATHGTGVAVPGAQNFRERDPEDHGCCVLAVDDGPARGVSTDGVATAAALAEDAVAVVEEPVVYHDEGTERGAYRLHRCALG